MENKDIFIKLIAGDLHAYVSLDELNKYLPESVITLKFQTTFNHNDYTFVVTNDDNTIPSKQTFDTLVEYLTTGEIFVDYNSTIPITPEVKDLFKFLNLPDDPHDVLEFGDEYHPHDDLTDMDIHEMNEHERNEQYFADIEEEKQRAELEFEMAFACHCNRPICKCQ